MFKVVPVNAMLVSPPVASSFIKSTSILPTFVMSLSPKDKSPANAVIVVVPIVPPLTKSPLIASLGSVIALPINVPLALMFPLAVMCD